ncbi:hypothetical protein NIES2104_41130 [Leptolyngbya sp. NIES-2104]|nr:hypothetical protein NIES2104_41130 [Leptolyngbya sp. NIES-2104]
MFVSQITVLQEKRKSFHKFIVSAQFETLVTKDKFNNSAKALLGGSFS